MPNIVPGHRGMALDLAPRLRHHDANELIANGRCPTAGLLRCCDLSVFLRGIEANGQVIGLFGFAPIDDETACPWLLGSDALVTDHRAWFIRNSMNIVTSGDHRWTHFFNRVDARNALHLKWLRYTGFSIGRPEPHGPHSLPFHPIHRTAPQASRH